MMCSWNSGVHRLGIFFFDAVDQIDAEVEVDRLVAQDVLELLADSCHFILPVEGEDHHKSAIEEDPFHDDVVADQVFKELLGAFGCVRW